MANWKNIKKVRDHIAKEKPSHVTMWSYLSAYSGKTVETCRADCGTAGCIFGHAFIALAPKTSTLFEFRSSAITELLGLNEEESSHMRHGHWRNLAKTPRLEDLTKRHVLRYLDKAIAAKDVMVTL